MKLIQRANKQLRIQDDKLDYYVGLGYHEVKLEEPPAKETKKQEPKEAKETKKQE